MPLSSCLLRVPGLFDDAGGFIFLLRDDFITPASAPLASPRTCEPGPGTLTVMNTVEFIDADGLQQNGNNTAWIFGLYGPAYNNAAGMAVLGRVKTGLADLNAFVGFAIATTTAYTKGVAGAYFVDKDSVLNDRGAEAAVGFDPPDGSFADYYGIRRNGGSFLIIGGKLYWIGTYNATTLYPWVTSFDLALTTRTFRVARLPGLGSDPVPGNGINVLGTRDLDLCSPGTGSGTSSIAAPAAGNTFVHTADTLIQFAVTAMPDPGADVYILFRGNANFSVHWLLYFNAAGELVLSEYNGSYVSAATAAAGTVTAGSVIAAKAIGTTIAFYVNGALKVSYASATVGSANTNGKMLVIGAGAVLANLTARTLDGVANVGSANHPGYGLATDVLPGPRAVGDTFTHEADCVFEYIVDALPSVTALVMWFRRESAGVYELVYITPTGQIVLEENAITRGSAGAGTVTNGARIVVVADGATIRVYVNTTLAISYNAAIVLTPTNGLFSADGTGGRISNLIAWPRSLATAPNTPGAAEALNGLTRMAQ